MANETTQRYLLLINELISEKKVSNGADFAQEIGVSSSSITEITKGRTNVGLSVLQKTVLKFPDINLDWLITGEGEIFKTKCAENVINKNDNINDNINDTKRNVQETLSFADGSEGFIEVPITEIEAAAGGGSPNPDYIDISNIIRLPSAMLSRTTAERLCINVVGESMEPTIPDGSNVIVRALHRADWVNMKSNYVYVVTDREGSTWVKRVNNCLRLNGTLILSSDNDNRRYRPIVIEGADLHNIWIAELMLTKDLGADLAPSVIPIDRAELDDMRIEMHKELAKITALVKNRK